MHKFFLVILEWKHVCVFLYWEVKGNLILHLEPEPLPAVIDQIQDEELDLSMEHESLGETENIPMTETETVHSSEADGKNFWSEVFYRKSFIL